MRALLCIFVFLLGFLGFITEGQFQVGPQKAAAFNPLKYCIKNCVQDGSKSVSACRKAKCSQLKSKKAKKRCERKCDKPGGLLGYCDNSCKKSQVCSRGVEMKACLKKKCEPFRKSDIHRYIKCKKTDCGNVCKNRDVN